jgi:hypothetical protein
MISLAQDPDHVPIDGAGATQHQLHHFIVL